MTNKTRIWYQSMTPLGRLPNYRNALQGHARQVCSEGVDVAVHGASERWFAHHMPGQIFKYALAKHTIQNEIIDTARHVQAEGFDAMVLGSFSEPFLTEIRSVLNIPVVSMAESALLLACSFAETFSLVCLAPSQTVRVQHVLDRHGLNRRIRDVTTLQHAVHEAELDGAFAHPQPIIEDFTAVAARAVDAGADAVIAAEGVLNEVLFYNGVRQVGGATVVDAVGSALLYAELMVNMQRRIGIGVGRRWAYATPPADVLEVLDSNIRR